MAAGGVGLHRGHELTPTMTLRRRVVDDLYAAEIVQLFA